MSPCFDVEKKSGEKVISTHAMTIAAAKVLQYKSRDVAVKTVSRCGNVRISVANTLNASKAAIQRHSVPLGGESLSEGTGQSIAPHLRMSEIINFSTLLASFLDQEERVAMHHKFAGAHHLVSESMALGECRGYASFSNDGDDVEGHSSSSNKMESIRVDRVLYRQARPVTSVASMSYDEFHEFLQAQYPAPQSQLALHSKMLFERSLTPHAWNFYRKSEGVAATVLVHSAMTEERGEVPSSSSSSSIHEQLVYNTGLILQPIVSEQVTSTLASLQRACFVLAAATATPADPRTQAGGCVEDASLAAVAAAWRSTLLKRAQEDRTNIQDLLSFATGDYESAFAVAEGCRLPTSTIASCANNIEPLRKLLLGNDSTQTIELDSSEGAMQRTPIDFFCRCSKEDFIRVLKSCSREQLEGAKGQVVTCKYCKKDISPGAEEWEQLISSAQA